MTLLHLISLLGFPYRRSNSKVLSMITHRIRLGAFNSLPKMKYVVTTLYD